MNEAWRWWIVPWLWIAGSSAIAEDREPPIVAERKALAFLATEVPRWSVENRCFSCHNNGDAAKALILDPKSPPESLAATLDFLTRPDRWEKNGTDAAFSDKSLARLQFASALNTAVKAGRVADRSLLLGPAEALARDQAEDGSWRIDDAAPVGSPATYGPPIASAVALDVLRASDPKRFARNIARAEDWLRKRPIANVHDASAVLLALPELSPADRRIRLQSFELLQGAQNGDGGWGPFRRSSPEAFDTALALLALSRWANRAEAGPILERGRLWLARSQAPDGGWPATTRPPGGDSYAERISTTGWATQALQKTRVKDEAGPSR